MARGSGTGTIFLDDAQPATGNGKTNSAGPETGTRKLEMKNPPNENRKRNSGYTFRDHCTDVTGGTYIRCVQAM